jgi:hypothetical protein
MSNNNHNTNDYNEREKKVIELYDQGKGTRVNNSTNINYFSNGFLIGPAIMCLQVVHSSWQTLVGEGLTLLVLFQLIMLLLLLFQMSQALDVPNYWSLSFECSLTYL